MALTKQDIVRDLRRCGLRPGDKVLVHSSLSSPGRVEGGADTVIDAMLEAVGPAGTVLFPALTGTVEDSADKPPGMDVRSTPTWCGVIPDTAWRREEAVRSLNATHSVAAIGADAEALTAGHEAAETPCGKGSPYVKLAEAGGFILLIGVDHNRNTTFHSAEEIARMPYLFQPSPAMATLTDGEGRQVTVQTRVHRWDVPRDFERMHAPLLEAGIARLGTVGCAQARLIKSNELIRFLVDVLSRDPHALLAPPSA